jgi:hemerythrin-like metal-binding protein
MSFFEWDESLDVCVDGMNAQHKNLISLMDALYNKNLACAPKQELLDGLANLLQYVLKHFKDEEDYMASISFVGLETHKKLHQNLLTDLSMFVDKFKNSEAQQLSSEFIMFLKFWLSTHIRGIDTKYGMV